MYHAHIVIDMPNRFNATPCGEKETLDEAIELVKDYIFDHGLWDTHLFALIEKDGSDFVYYCTFKNHELFEGWF